MFIPCFALVRSSHDNSVYFLTLHSESLVSEQLGQTGPKSQICHLLAEWYQVNHELSLALAFHIYKMRKNYYLFHESKRVKMIHTALPGTESSIKDFCEY